jgi:superfamily I DNA and/or RNA helicase
VENVRGGYGRSLFERLLEVGHYRERMGFLNIQYRQPPRNSAWTSTEFYDGRLQDAETLVTSKPLDNTA